VGANWAGSHDYRAAGIEHPATVGELRALLAAGGRLHALGSRHSFMDVADTSGTLVALDRLAPDLVIDEEASTASFSAGLRYGELAAQLHARGWAIHNLASLPHISVAGAVATGTHGSGDGNGTLATAVAGLEYLDGTGELVRITRADAEFDGSVVAVGALGIVTRITLDIEPTFEVRQDVYTDLPWDAVFSDFDAITSSAYSVSLFHDWLGDTIGLAWLKSRMDAAAPPTDLFGATLQTVDRHMLPGQPVEYTTPQSGLPGPWSDRLAHFKLEFTPSNGDELQSEFLLPRANILAALASLREIGERIAPLLLVTELRTMAADRLWLSGAYGTDAVGVHFTWKMRPAEVLALLPEIESRLLPLGGRPHWGKVFVAEADAIAPLYPRFDDFRALVARHDPDGRFRNDFLARRLGIE
jgi:xylitol oxidase